MDSMAQDLTPLITELRWRGLLHQCSDESSLVTHLAGGERKGYIGFDPTADSLTIGNLVQITMLARLRQAGHEPVVVMGGGTGMIGDPGGKSAERPLLSIDQIEANVVSQRRIFDALLPGAPVFNNIEWLAELSYIDLLRDIGKQFSVNAMLQRDSVRSRLNGVGISYTEFSYMVLQAYDFAHLHEHQGVTLQMGGSDQWGNIVSGVDLIRRRAGTEAFALTTPLLTKSDGAKFGKSESGAIWLTEDRTSPYAFHQFWLNTDDADLDRYLKTFSYLGETEIGEVVAASAADPGRRIGQRVLADELTTRLHGPDAAARAIAAGTALFTGQFDALDRGTLDEVFAGVPSSVQPRAALDGEGCDLVQLLVDTQLAPSRRQAREFLATGSVTVNGRPVGPESRLTAASLLHDTTAALRRGKKTWHVTRWE